MDFGLRVGDKIVLDGKSVRGDICSSALMVLRPEAFALSYDANFPSLRIEARFVTACPDEDGPVALKVQRVKK